MNERPYISLIVLSWVCPHHILDMLRTYLWYDNSHVMWFSVSETRMLSQRMKGNEIYIRDSIG